LPKGNLVSAALKEGFKKLPPKMKPPEAESTPEDAHLTPQEGVSKPPKPGLGSSVPSDPSDEPDYVTRPEFQGLCNEIDGLFDTVKDETMEKIEEVRKSLSSDLAAYVAGITDRPVHVTVSLPELAKDVTLHRRPHAAFTKVLALVRAGLNVMMVGPGGSGKTTLAEDVAAALGRAIYIQSMTAGTSESALTVRLMPLGAGGAMRPVASPVLCRFGGKRNVLGEDGLVHIEDDDAEAGVILFDEADAGDANTTVVLNSALSNRKMMIEALAMTGKSVIVNQHPNCVILAAANTFGTGMDLQYAGRNALDAAFLDRWYMVYINYDPVMMAQIAGLPVPQHTMWQPAMPPSDAEWRGLSRWVLETGERIKTARLKKIWGTRALTKAKAARYAGVPAEEVKADLMLGWPPDQVALAMGEETKSW
jgi:MoxR-like ATPase